MSPFIIGILITVMILLGLATWKAPRLTSVIWWSLVATIFVGAAGLLVLPGNFADNALWLTLAVPLIWAAFQFWSYWEKRAWRVPAGLIAISVLSAIIVFSIEPVIG